MIADFHFLRPLWLLALLPLPLVLWQLRRAAGAGAWRKVCDPHLLAQLLSDSQGGGRKIPLALLGIGWLLAVLALAGPVWSQYPLPVMQSRDALVIVLDLSRSMLAADLKPSRLVQARFKAADALERRREGQTGLVAFAGDAFAVAPLTTDSATLTALLPVLSPDIMPVQGSRADLGLEKAGELLDGIGDVLLITDSADAAALAAARALRERGVTVSVLGVGTPAG
ncbi:MAG: VWA domain-containing protein, partial [Pseudomonadota bacterium]|nr:VWA domain-containing protein [Pseudomonadota bacterium]